MASSLKLFLKLYLRPLMAGLFIAGIMSSFASQAHSNCNYANKNILNKMTPVSFGTIVISRDHPIGTTIGEIRLDQVIEQGNIALCHQPTPASWDESGFIRANYNNDAIYESGVPGVGIRINTWGPGYGIDWLPRIVERPSTCNTSSYSHRNGQLYCGRTWGYLTVQLIKIAPTTGSGDTHRQVLTRARLGNGITVNTFYLENTHIITQGCSLKQNTTFVNMGDIRKSEFRGIYSTAGDKSFELGLDCDANLNVQVLLDGRPAKNNANNIWALDYSSDNVTATGVGLQILYRNRPISMRAPFVSGSTQSGGYIQIPLSARYIQTDTRITPGKADATATVTLTYQ
ncbi:fimbrial protein [Xenorhabdus sp. DI]|uniref:fimbrial protein n=1 Tax=Xenorhabdus doucetiae TaxID=351671 RepID=UPI0019B93EAA|nr:MULTISPECIES: fimbrial protein [unclassified Xenorhabdus]MBD2785569.1 fimbrial protein [Xenorhabdus sp. 3]MBD2786954.1 fimbrial protein [Xenorhabdus sp. DI]